MCAANVHSRDACLDVSLHLCTADLQDGMDLCFSCTARCISASHALQICKMGWISASHALQICRMNQSNVCSKCAQQRCMPRWISASLHCRFARWDGSLLLMHA